MVLFFGGRPSYVANENDMLPSICCLSTRPTRSVNDFSNYGSVVYLPGVDVDEVDFEIRVYTVKVSSVLVQKRGYVGRELAAGRRNNVKNNRSYHARIRRTTYKRPRL